MTLGILFSLKSSQKNLAVFTAAKWLAEAHLPTLFGAAFNVSYFKNM